VGPIPEVGTSGRLESASNPKVIPDPTLTDEVNGLLNASVSANTHQSYAVGLQAFDQFTAKQGLELIWPRNTTHSIVFIARISLQGYSQATAKSYIVAISFNSKIYGTLDPTKSFVILKLMKGKKCTNTRKDPWLPITIDILENNLDKLHVVCYNTYEIYLFRAAFTLAFHGLLRVTLSKVNESSKFIQTRDISVQCNETVLIIKYSKTNQLGRSTQLLIQATTGLSCPV
jgi:hypothetical protein